MQSKSDILIIGAGPTGLTLGCELARHGLPFRIIETAAHASDKSKALGIHARTLEVFEFMGLIDTFLQLGWKLNGVKAYNDRKEIASFALDNIDSPYPFALSLPQSETEAILGKHLVALGGQVERNTSLKSFSQSEGAVTATIALSDGTQETQQYSWLIGCDGAHSTVRHCLKMPFDGTELQEAFFLADVAISSSLDMTKLHMFTTEEGLLGIFPFSARRGRVVADLDKDKVRQLLEPQREQRNSSSLVKLPPPTMEQITEIARRRGPADLVLSDEHWLSAFSIQQRQVKSYRSNRVFLAGDAAHVHSPAGGQGMNTGIQDVFNLAWKLALVEKGLSSDALLESYALERHAVGQGVLRMTDFFTKVNTMRNPVAQTIRAKLAPVVASLEVVQSKFAENISELAVNYKHSPIVAEHKATLVESAIHPHSWRPESKLAEPDVAEWFNFNCGPHAGDRAPDGHAVDRNGNVRRLYQEISGTKHHLILLSGAGAVKAELARLIEIADSVAEKYQSCIESVMVVAAAETTDISLSPDHGLGEAGWSGTTLLDKDLSLHHRYGADASCLYLIRPDGYVGYRSLPVDKNRLFQYLSTIFV